MKALILTCEDCISPDVWLLHARQYLSLGRTVMAITEADNRYNAVGTGDGLPAYWEDLTSNPRFVNYKVPVDKPEVLLQELDHLAPDTAVLWNLDVFEYAARRGAWKAVLDACLDSERDVIFMHWSYSAWRDGRMTDDEAMVKSVRWDYVAGSRVITPFNASFVLDVLPHMRSALAGLSNGPEIRFGWHVVTPRGATGIAFKSMDEWLTHPQILRTLACNSEAATEMDTHQGSVSDLPPRAAYNSAPRALKVAWWKKLF